MTEASKPGSTVAIIQARMSSSRLPGKVLEQIRGRPMLQIVHDRVHRADGLDAVVIATSTDPSDDAIESFCSARGIPCFRGSREDVLARFFEAANAQDASVVVRVTADCPLLDPAVIEELISTFRNGRYDYVATRLPGKATFPVGVDAEVFSFEALSKAFHHARERYQREHVTPYLYDGSAGYRVASLTASEPHPEYRWTVDTAEDLAFVRRVFDSIGFDVVDWKAVARTVSQHPEWAELNSHVRQKLYTESEEPKPG